MADMLLDLTTYLVNNGYANTDGVDIFRDYKPDKPDNITILTEYSGSPYDPNLGIANRSVQISVRDIDPDMARTKIMSLFRLFEKMPNEKVQLTDDRWCLFYIRQTPFKLGTDNKGRAMQCFNIGITTNVE